jgi:elongation factor 1-gamma
VCVFSAEWKPVFEVGPDYESYEFTPLDFAKDKEIIGKNWAWEDEMDGLKVADGKVFK